MRVKADSDRAAFFISERRVRAAWWSLAAFGLGAIFYAWQIPAAYGGRGIGVPWWLWSLAAASFGFVSFHRAWVLGHRDRPVVQIGDEDLEWGSTYSFTAKRHRVSFGDLRSIHWKNPNVIRLGTAAGNEVSMRLAEVADDERAIVFKSISSSIDNPSAASSGNEE